MAEIPELDSATGVIAPPRDPASTNPFDAFDAEATRPSLAERAALWGKHQYYAESLFGSAGGAAAQRGRQNEEQVARSRAETERYNNPSPQPVDGETPYEASVRSKAAQRRARDDIVAPNPFDVWDNVRQDLLRYEAMPDANGPLEHLAAVAGALGGSMLSPESYVFRFPGAGPVAGWLGERLGWKIGGTAVQMAENGIAQALVNTATDPAVQGFSMLGNFQQKYDPFRTLVSAPLAGAALGAGLTGAGALVAKGASALGNALTPMPRLEGLTPHEQRAQFPTNEDRRVSEAVTADRRRVAIDDPAMRAANETLDMPPAKATAVPEIRDNPPYYPGAESASSAAPADWPEFHGVDMATRLRDQPPEVRSAIAARIRELTGDGPSLSLSRRLPLEEASPELRAEVEGILDRIVPQRDKRAPLFVDRLRTDQAGAAAHGVDAAQLGDDGTHLVAGMADGLGLSTTIQIARALPNANEMFPWVARHESIHALRRIGLFTADEWRTLVDANTKYGWAENAGKLDSEEGIAEAFAAWGTKRAAGDTPLKVDKEIARIFQKIVDFYQRLKESLSGKYREEWERIFSRIESGEMGARDISGSRQAPLMYYSTWNDPAQARALAELFQKQSAANDKLRAEFEARGEYPSSKDYRANLKALGLATPRRKNASLVAATAPDWENMTVKEIFEHLQSVSRGKGSPAPSPSDAFARPQIGDATPSASMPARPELGEATVTAKLNADQIKADTGAEIDGTLIRQLRGGLPTEPDGITGYHGSPHDFERFSTNKIGTGEGNQMYGHGLYFGEQRATAEKYQKDVIDKAYFDNVNKRLSEIAKELRQYELPGQYGKYRDQRGYELKAEYDRLMEERSGKKGSLYEVRIAAKPEHFLDWDKPLSQQSPEVQAVLKRLGIEEPTDPLALGTRTGAEAYTELGYSRTRSYIEPAEASRVLRENGIAGIRYADGGSRTALPSDAIAQNLADVDRRIALAQKEIQTLPESARAEYQGEIDRLVKEKGDLERKLKPTYNYVVFDDNNIHIVAKNGKKLAQPMPVVDFLKGEATGKFVDPMRGDAVAAARQAAQIVRDAPAGSLPSFRSEAVQAPPGPNAPAGIFMFDAPTLKVDAKRFQFKENGDTEGVTARLKGVSRWDQAKGNQIIVWQDKAGDLYVVDGHQRTGLARRLIAEGKEAKIELPGLLYREADGITAEDVRAIAAAKNLGEGSGSALDGAKVLRTRPDLLDGSLPLTEGKTRQAVNLARLEDEPFRMVVNEVVPENYGAVVGEVIPKDGALQEAAIKALARFEPRNVEEATALVQRVKESELARAEEGKQTSLFGDTMAAESTAGEEMRIVAKVIQDAKRDKALLGRVVDNASRIEQTGSTIQRDAAQAMAGDSALAAKLMASEAYSAGPVRDALLEAARNVKAGKQTLADATRDVFAAVRRQAEGDVRARAGDSAGSERAPEGSQAATEAGADGFQQGLIPGVSPVTDAQRIAVEAAKPMRGGNAELPGDGLFGDSANQEVLFLRRDKSFAKWFGKSVVVDSEGKPLVVYKGMNALDWETGDPIKSINSPNAPYAGFFSNDPNVANRFADALTPYNAKTFRPGVDDPGSASVFPVYIKMEKPFVIDANGKPAAAFQFDSPSRGWSSAEYKAALANKKYDGVIIRNTKDEGDVYIPKEPTQIKSVNNSGTFDPADPDILNLRRGKQSPLPSQTKDGRPLRDTGTTPTEAAHIQRVEDIGRELVDAFETVARTGRVTPGAQAIYKIKSGVVRTRSVSDIDAVAHEVGHHFHIALAKPEGDAIVRANVSELSQFGAGASREGDLEAFANLFHAYTMNRPFAERNYPNATAALDNLLRTEFPDQHKALQNIRESLDALYRAPSVDAVTVDQISKNPPRFGDTLREALARDIDPEGRTVFSAADALYTATVDSKHPIYRAMTGLVETAKANGKDIKLLPMDDAYILSRRIAGSYQKADTMLKYGVIPVGSNTPQGASFAGAIETALGKKWDAAQFEAFGAYLTSRRMVAEYERFLAGELDRKPGKYSLADYQNAVTEFETRYPNFVEGANQLYAFQRAHMKRMFDKGLVTREFYELTMNRKDYVPVQRDMSDFAGEMKAKEGPIAGRDLAYSVAKSFKGSDRSVINPLESIYKRIHDLEFAAQSNDTVMALARLSESAGPGAGYIMEPIPNNQLRAQRVDVIEALRAAGRAEGMDQADLANLILQVEDHLGDSTWATLFRQEPITPGKEPIVFGWVNGERRAYRLGDGKLGVELYHALTAMNDIERNWLLATLQIGQMMLRTGVTKSLDFIPVNFVRDQFTASLTGGRNYVPFYSAGKGLVNILRDADVAIEAAGQGVIAGGAVVHSIEQSKFGKNVKSLTHGNLFHQIARTFELSEAGTRVGLYESYFKEAKALGWDDANAGLWAAYRADDYIDFRKYGSGMGFIRRVVPFLNAHVQGTDKDIRSAVSWPVLEAKRMSGETLSDTELEVLRASRAGVIKLVTLGIVGGAGLAFMNQDNERFTNAPKYLRDNNFLFSVGGQDFSVPKGFGVVQSVVNLFERGAEFAIRRDPQILLDYMSGVGSTFAVPTGTPFINVPKDLWANYDSFRDRPIVPYYMQGWDKPEQYGAWTSTLAKQIAAGANAAGVELSPMKIDYTMQQLGGGMARDVMFAWDAIMGKDRPEKQIYDYPVLRRFVKNFDRGSQANSAFHALVGQVNGTYEQAENAYRGKINAGERQGAADYLRNLKEDDRAWTVLNTQGFDTSAKRLHPMYNARERVQVMSGLVRQMAVNNVIKEEDLDRRDLTRSRRDATPIAMDAKQRAQATEHLLELTVATERNAMVTIGAKGTVGLRLMDTAPILERLRGVSPELAQELDARLKKKALPTPEESAKAWPEMKRRLLVDGENADLNDLIPSTATARARRRASR